MDGTGVDWGGDELPEDVARQQGDDVSDDEESIEGSRFVMQDGGSGGDWSGHDPRSGTTRDRAHFLAGLQERAVASQAQTSGARATARRSMGTDGEGVHGLQMPGNGHDDFGDDDDRQSLGGGAGDDPTYDGFDERLFQVEGDAIPLLKSVKDLWAPLSGNLGPTEFKPKRAMRIACIATLFARDAEFFNQWQLPKGHESRARATASLVSLLFAGTAMGLPSGSHEENTRNQQASDQHEDETGGAGAKSKAPKPLTRVQRYTFIPKTDVRDSHPMFQIGFEEIYNHNQTEVLALGVWLFINDETHSTSSLVAKVIADTKALHDGARASAQTAFMRDKSVCAENARHDKSGRGFADISSNFEKNTGLQYQLIKGRDDFIRMLNIHSGMTSGKPGRPCVPDMARHLNCAAGRRSFQGDSRTGAGGRHPLAPEFLFNAKTRDGLAFGLVGLDGEQLDVCDEQMDPNQYWDAAGHFRLPVLDRESFWICTSYEARTPFDLPLQRPLQGTVLPGHDLMQLFLEEERRLSAGSNVHGGGEEGEEGEEGEGGARSGGRGASIDQGAYNRMRSLMTKRDQYAAQMDSMLSNSNQSYDQMSPGGLEVASHNPDADETKGEANYTLRTVSMTQRVTQETGVLWTSMVQPWKTRTENQLNKMHARLEKADRLDRRTRREEGRERDGGVADDDDDGDGDDCDMDVDDDEVGDARVHDTWENYEAVRAKYQARLFKVKRDVVQYHSRLLKSCFLSTRDAATLPAGYKAMHSALEKGVRERGGSASIAFSGVGYSLRQTDRMAWGALQEWLRMIFVDDCRVAGRDRRIMDEMYFTCFEMYHKTTFILVVASEKGCGKSVRAVRLMAILPEGWCTKNSGNTGRSHANGNNSPSNGTVIMHDEMISDLLPADCTEKMEAIKTMVGEREIEIERTRSVKSVDGTDQHVTYKIVTDHKEVWIICCNMGQCFTVGQEEPSPGKDALIQRTVCLQARSEASEDSPDKDFKAGLHFPDVARRVSDFRLFTSLVGWALLMIKDLPWLQPDFAIANLIFKEGDKMLTREYALPSPEPRRLVKRLSNLTTMCVQEAVARLFLFKQTAAANEVGRPMDDGSPPKFEIGDMWEVVRTLHPTREMIIAAWSYSLEYSIGTSSHGVNVMDAICERLGFQIDKVFRKQYPEEAKALMTAPDGEGSEMEPYMHGVRHETAGGSSVNVGASTLELSELQQQLAKSRTSRCEFRHAAVGSIDHGGDPLQSIKAMAGTPERAERFANAVFPSIRTVSCYYKPKALLRWAAGHSIKRAELHNQGAGGGTGLPYKLKNGRRGALDGNDGDGGPKEYDHAWFVISEASNKEGGASWRACAAVLMKSKMCTMFDMHSAGIADAVYMLSTKENKRPCPEMPHRLPFTLTQTQAFRDENGNAFGKNSQEMRPAPFRVHPSDGGCSDPLLGPPVEARTVNDPDHRDSVPIHAQIDMLHNRGRLPAMMPHTSTRVENSAPIRWVPASGIEVNAITVYEHTVNKMEAILLCAKIPGLKGLQENFLSGGKAPACLRAESAPAGVPVAVVNQATVVLPYSIDIQQIAWSVQLAQRFYTPGKKQAVESFNRRLRNQGLSPPLTEVELPELSLRYPGFPKPGGEPALRLISVPLGDQEPDDSTKKVEISKANPLQSIDAELLRYQTEVAIGREATFSDIESHRRSLIGSGYTWGVQGDVFSYDTYQDHLCASMIGRGNVDPVEDSNQGGYADKVFESILDSEYMLEVRYLERRAVKGETPEVGYKITLPQGSTYRHLEAAAHASAQSQLSGNKRPARPQPGPRPQGRSGAQVMRERTESWGAQALSDNRASSSSGAGRSRPSSGAGSTPGVDGRRKNSRDDDDDD